MRIKVVPIFSDFVAAVLKVCNVQMPKHFTPTLNHLSDSGMQDVLFQSVATQTETQQLENRNEVGIICL